MELAKGLIVLIFFYFETCQLIAIKVQTKVQGQQGHVSSAEFDELKSAPEQVFLTVAGNGQNPPLSSPSNKFSKEDRVGLRDFPGQVMPKKSIKFLKSLNGLLNH